MKSPRFYAVAYYSSYPFSRQLILLFISYSFFPLCIKDVAWWPLLPGERGQRGRTQIRRQLKVHGLCYSFEGGGYFMYSTRLQGSLPSAMKSCGPYPPPRLNVPTKTNACFHLQCMSSLSLSTVPLTLSSLFVLSLLLWPSSENNEQVRTVSKCLQ
jgi:hypothetical protein